MFLDRKSEWGLAQPLYFRWVISWYNVIKIVLQVLPSSCFELGFIFFFSGGGSAKRYTVHYRATYAISGYLTFLITWVQLYWYCI